MKVLFAVWELDPFIKFGGLGDVARSLPAALNREGIDTRVVIPFYLSLKLGNIKRTKILETKVRYAQRNEKVEIYRVNHPLTGIAVYLLRNRRYLDIARAVDTFAFYDKAVVEILKANNLSWQPDVVHCHDHHTGLIPLLIKESRMQIKTILTIHNLGYQGKTSLDVLDRLGVNKRKCRVIRWEIKSNMVNFLMEGIIHADVVTTVSSTYAKEIMTEEYGMGLDGVLRAREGRVFGILNGIDISWRDTFNRQAVKYPFKKKTDDKVEEILPQPSSWKKEKKQNKLFLQRKLGLRMELSVPLLSFIGRFTVKQKGIDIFHRMIRSLDSMKYEFIILGSGDEEWEERFLWLSKFYPKYVSCNFLYDDQLATQIYAASDFILIPSKYEPCGLVQMIAMYFGTLPIARRTGGLTDSITDGYNGFLFNGYTASSLTKAVEKAVGLWANNRSRYNEMVENALKTDFSWSKSAKSYIRLYEQLVKDKL